MLLKQLKNHKFKFQGAFVFLYDMKNEYLCSPIISWGIHLESPVQEC